MIQKGHVSITLRIIQQRHILAILNAICQILRISPLPLTRSFVKSAGLVHVQASFAWRTAGHVARHFAAPTRIAGPRLARLVDPAFGLWHFASSFFYYFSFKNQNHLERLKWRTATDKERERDRPAIDKASHVLISEQRRVSIFLFYCLQ